MLTYVLGLRTFASSFHFLCRTLLRIQHQQLNEKHGGMSGSFIFEDTFADSLTDLLWLLPNTSRGGYVNC